MVRGVVDEKEVDKQEKEVDKQEKEVVVEEEEQQQRQKGVCSGSSACKPWPLQTELIMTYIQPTFSSKHARRRG